MADLMDNFICGGESEQSGCGNENCACNEKCGCATVEEDGLSGQEKLLLVYKELVRTAERIGQNLPEAVPVINNERVRGVETVTLTVEIH